MKRNFDEQITDLDGQPVRMGASQQSLQNAINKVFAKLPEALQEELLGALMAESGKPLTLASACTTALMAAYEDERNLSADERVKRLELARRIHKGGILDIEPKDRDLLKPLLNKCFSGVLVPVVACELLEKEAPKGVK